jgi:eukaryotic-like serine/threonine-protein kinase
MPQYSFRIEDFQLGASLGQGTVGEIFAATEISTGRQVALKILLPNVSQDRLVRSRFEREIGILEKLRHPNIIEVYGGGEVGGRLFYAMELVNAGTVKDLLIRFGTLPWTEVATITRQVCSALQYAHNHGIIHRDLKPANLFLTREGHVKLGDFGIARDMQSSDITEQGLTVGTHAYMSPEQITADSQISGKTDLYALGCLMFEMLIGRPPFQGANFAQLFEQHLRTPAPRVSDLTEGVPDQMDTVIHQLLQKSPEARPFNARHVQGIMYELLESAQLKDASGEQKVERVSSVATELPSETCRIDVGADSTIDVGQSLLSKRLNAGTTAAPSSWTAVMTLAAIGLIIVVLGVLLQR